ncbi:hypothetical protein CVT26_005325 [Gymnopilus dilepis]|uniref:Uncharacterized protein n=1 Tax=Gymnopilus dilepis TaxID=231916 RepID=A0A409WJ49_9AGAR|nr:hypothetical protein CVT26_005325 [Gymnopilus dilepis]
MDATPQVQDTVIKFRHPCQECDGSTTRCNACLRMDELDADSEGHTIPSHDSTPYSTRAEIMRATRTAQNSHHDPIILRLPPELASRIFEFCRPPGCTDRVDVRFALILISVCQGWRRIALSTPRLWAQVAVDLADGLRAVRPELLKEWLGRSRGVPMTMTVDGLAYLTKPEPDVGSREYNEAGALIEVLNSCSDRWGDLSFYSVPREMMNLLEGNDRGTPALHSLFLTRIALPTIRFSLTNVKTVMAVLVRNAGMLFDMAPNMEECYIPLCAPRRPDVEGQDVLLQPITSGIVHRRLRKLTIASVEWAWQTEALLLRLTVPSLESLTVVGSSEEGRAVDMPLSAIHALLVTSECTLTELSLKANRYRTEELIDLLAQEELSSLERLEIAVNGLSEGENYLADVVFERLTETVGNNDDTARSFLPLLRSLTFDADSAYHLASFPTRRFPWDHFVKFLACHQPGTHADQHMRPLREVKLWFSCSAEEGSKRLNEAIYMDDETVRLLIDLSKKNEIELRIEERCSKEDLLMRCEMAIGALD